MSFFWVKTNRWIKRLLRGWIWDIPNQYNHIFLTFDDGPTPEITPWVLDQLATYNAKATFFCVGKNANLYPEIVSRIIAEGHQIGNHTHNHLNGFKCKTTMYCNDVVQCEQTLPQKTKLFRPPYGKINPFQAHWIQKKGYKIIMWDVLSVDYDASTPPEKCLQNVVQNTESGSIIVFHDSQKAFQNLSVILPKVLEQLSIQGFVFKEILYT